MSASSVDAREPAREGEALGPLARVHDVAALVEDGARDGNRVLERRERGDRARRAGASPP